MYALFMLFFIFVKKTKGDLRSLHIRKWRDEGGSFTNYGIVILGYAVFLLLNVFASSVLGTFLHILQRMGR